MYDVIFLCKDLQNERIKLLNKIAFLQIC